MKKIRPKVIVSECLGFSHCRYDGEIVSSPIIKRMKKYIDFIPVCPEVEIGLGIPRAPVRVLEDKISKRLIQPSTGKDLTSAIIDFSDKFIRENKELDGCVLKSRSPSCGIRGVITYHSPLSRSASGRGTGFFAAAVHERYPLLALEDEKRLNDLRIREYFLTKLFTFSRFRAASSSSRLEDLSRFLSKNHLLFMAYNQKELKAMEKLLGDDSGRSAEETRSLFRDHLGAAFKRPPRLSSNINILLHAMSYFSYNLTHEEKGFFLESMERYRERKLPLSSLLLLLRVWIKRFKTKDLKDQTYFAPYPDSLVNITDSAENNNCR